MTRKGLDVSHTDVSYRDVSGLSPQHDVKDQDMRSRHSEGVLQSKTTEESNQTQSEESNRDVSLRST